MKTKQIDNCISVKRERYGYIDSVRGLAVVGMIIYHFLFDILYIYGIYPDFFMDAQYILLQRFVGVSFFIVAGISVNLSSRPFSNGILVSICGLGVSAVTLAFMPEEPIIFGVLTFLGFSMMLIGALRKALSKVNAVAGMLLSLILFVLTYGMEYGFIGVFYKPLFYLPDWMYKTSFLAFFSLPGPEFVSSDYYPLFPWLFLVTFGFFLWRFILKHKFDGYFLCGVPVLDFIGRHSLLIYILHQPVLYGVCMLIFGY